MPIVIERQGDVAVLRLEMPRGNAIGTTFVAELGAAVDRALADAPGALVVVGAGRVFSTGLDLVEAHGLEGADLERYVDAFDDLFTRLFGLEVPWVAALNGHAVAGGCILACAAHARVVARAELSIGVSEAILGVPFPMGARLCIDEAMPPACHAKLFGANERVGAAEALALGFADELVEPGRLVESAVALAGTLAPSAAALAASRRRVLAERQADRAPSRRRFLDAWRSEPVRARVAAARDAVLARKASG